MKEGNTDQWERDRLLNKWCQDSWLSKWERKNNIFCTPFKKIIGLRNTLSLNFQKKS